MFREMRRNDRQMSDEAAIAVIQSQNFCVLSVNGDDGYPYGVPVNYGYTDGKFYIHSTSKESHKLEAIRQNEKVCLTIVARHELEAAKYTTNYSSVIVFGNARLITEAAEKTETMYKMMQSLAPEMADKAKEHCKGTEHTYTMIEVVPAHITGKAK